MSNTSKFTERFGARVQTRVVSRVKSGFPVRLSLGFEPDANTPEAARVLVRRHLSVRAAHAALTEMLDRGKSYVIVPCVENLTALKRDLKKVGVIAREHEPRLVDVRAVRKRTKLTQEKFAIKYGLDLATLKNWEQGRSKPDAAANTLLMIIHSNPQAVESSLEVDEKAASKVPYKFKQRELLTLE